MWSVGNSRDARIALENLPRSFNPFASLQIVHCTLYIEHVADSEITVFIDEARLLEVLQSRNS